jgi:hypothetical protein
VRRVIRNPDVASGTALIVFGAVATKLSLEISRGPDLHGVPPSFLPLVCAGGIILCGLVILLRGLLAAPAPLPTVFDRGSLGVGLLVGIYYWFFDHIDFRFGTWAFILGVMLVMGCRDRRRLLLVPVLGTAAIYVVFRYLFKILLPTWG